MNHTDHFSYNPTDVGVKCKACGIFIPPHAEHTCRSVTADEAVRHIEKDSDALSFLTTHGGFFTPDLPFRHPQHAGNGVILWPPVDIAPTAEIGEGTVIGRYTNIVGPVKIGRHCRLQGFNYIPTGVELKDYVFVGPGAIFTNVKYPKVRRLEDKVFEKTVIGPRANIGAGAIILPGIRIGKEATIGAGSVVTRDVDDGEIWYGVPARNGGSHAP